MSCHLMVTFSASEQLQALLNKRSRLLNHISESMTIVDCYNNFFLPGFNVETVEYKNISFTVWDVGGQDKVIESSIVS